MDKVIVICLSVSFLLLFISCKELVQKNNFEKNERIVQFQNFQGNNELNLNSIREASLLLPTFDEGVTVDDTISIIKVPLEIADATYLLMALNFEEQIGKQGSILIDSVTIRAALDSYHKKETYISLIGTYEDVCNHCESYLVLTEYTDSQGFGKANYVHMLTFIKGELSSIVNLAHYGKFEGIGSIGYTIRIAPNRFRFIVKAFGEHSSFGDNGLQLNLNQDEDLLFAEFVITEQGFIEILL